MEVIKGHWDIAPSERKISKNFKGAQGGTLKMAILVKSPMGAPKKYLKFFSHIQAYDIHHFYVAFYVDFK